MYFTYKIDVCFMGHDSWHDSLNQQRKTQFDNPILKPGHTDKI